MKIEWYDQWMWCAWCIWHELDGRIAIVKFNLDFDLPECKRWRTETSRIGDGVLLVRSCPIHQSRYHWCKPRWIHSDPMISSSDCPLIAFAVLFVLLIDDDNDTLKQCSSHLIGYLKMRPWLVVTGRVTVVRIFGRPWMHSKISTVLPRFNLVTFKFGSPTPTDPTE